MNRIYPGLLVLAAITGGSCQGPTRGEHSSTAVSRITLTGSSTVAPLMAEIGKRFESLHPELRVDVQTGGSARGIADIRRGLCDIGMVSRDLYPQEADLQATTIARDGICMIVHKTNPVQELSEDLIRSIYTGKIRNWIQAGGRDAPITVVNKAEGRSTLELFLHYFKLKNSQIQADVIIGDNEQGVKVVAGNPGALGYVSIGVAETDAASGVSIRLLPLDGVAATVENVERGRFPLGRSLNLVLKEKPSAAIRQLLEFAVSEQVEDLIRGLSFVPLRKAPPN